MEEIISYIMETPENVNGNILREKLKEFKGSGGGVLMVTDTDRTLDKTMGEIQDAYLSGKRIVIHRGIFYADAVCVVTVNEEKGEYAGSVCAYFNGDAFIAYVALGETEEAARNAYPMNDL